MPGKSGMCGGSKDQSCLVVGQSPPLVVCLSKHVSATVTAHAALSSLRTAVLTGSSLVCAFLLRFLRQFFWLDAGGVRLADRPQLLLTHLLDLLRVGDLRRHTQGTACELAPRATRTPSRMAVAARTTWYWMPFCLFSSFFFARSSLTARAACARRVAAVGHCMRRAECVLQPHPLLLNDGIRHRLLRGLD